MSKRSKFIVISLLILFSEIMLSMTANAISEESIDEMTGNEQKSAEDPRCEKWKEIHTVKVEVTRVYNYEKEGKLKVTEIYSGKELKSKFKDDKFTRSQTFIIPEGEGVTISTESGSLKLQPGEEKKIVTQESAVLTTENDPYPYCSSTSSDASSTSSAYPQWTFSKVNSLFKTYYKMEDPINLVWKEKDLKSVKNVFLSKKWVDNPVEYTHYLSYPDGKWVAGDGMADSKYRLSGGYHLRLWQLPDGDIVSNAHHDDNVLIIPGHQVDGYENAEAKVTGFFGTVCGTYWLDNEFYNSEYNAYNDGYATLV
ncbi:hypothetical protein RSJ42_09465 [Methanosarcina hadiensis]|uniref:hypothetical protein n=1 Tax=Methanosarcina hadiensis TaxID=3078083 RepID=UPI0039775A63